MVEFPESIGKIELEVIAIPCNPHHQTLEGAVQEYFESLGYYIRKLNPARKGVEVGSPDFFVSDDEGTDFYVEAKTNYSDNVGFRLSQIDWFLNHPDETVFLALPTIGNMRR